MIEFIAQVSEEDFKKIINGETIFQYCKLVRCKDCKWYMYKQKNLPYNVTKRYCNRTCTLATEEDDYCSYGERREP